MEKNDIHTPAETWADFWNWFKGCPEWDTTGREEKQYLDKTNREMSAGKCGIRRLQNILDKYAPGRYEYAGGFIFTNKK